MSWQPRDDVNVSGGNRKPRTFAVKVLRLLGGQNLPFQTRQAGSNLQKKGMLVPV